MNLRVEKVDKLPELPEDALGFGPDGWQPRVTPEVTVQYQTLTLPQVLLHIQNQHGNLLGEGTLIFYQQSDDRDKREAKGWFVFLPEPSE